MKPSVTSLNAKFTTNTAKKASVKAGEAQGQELDFPSASVVMVVAEDLPLSGQMTSLRTFSVGEIRSQASLMMMTISSAAEACSARWMVADVVADVEVEEVMEVIGNKCKIRLVGSEWWEEALVEASQVWTHLTMMAFLVASLQCLQAHLALAVVKVLLSNSLHIWIKTVTWSLGLRKQQSMQMEESIQRFQKKSVTQLAE